MTLPDGLYDLLVTERLSGQLDESSSRIQSLPQGASALLVEAISRQLVGILDDLPDDAHRANHQLALMNGMLIDLRQRIRTESGSPQIVQVIDLLASPLRVLKGIQSAKQFHTAPEIGLSRPWLFTAGKGSPSLLQEIRLELASCDRVDILVSFITVSGVRKLQAGQCLVFQRCSRCHTFCVRGRVMTVVFEQDFRQVRGQSGNR